MEAQPRFPVLLVRVERWRFVRRQWGCATGYDLQWVLILLPAACRRAELGNFCAPQGLAAIGCGLPLVYLVAQNFSRYVDIETKETGQAVTAKDAEATVELFQAKGAPRESGGRACEVGGVLPGSNGAK